MAKKLYKEIQSLLSWFVYWGQSTNCFHVYSWIWFLEKSCRLERETPYCTDENTEALWHEVRDQFYNLRNQTETRWLLSWRFKLKFFFKVNYLHVIHKYIYAHTHMKRNKQRQGGISVVDSIWGPTLAFMICLAFHLRSWPTQDCLKFYLISCLPWFLNYSSFPTLSTTWISFDFSSPSPPKACDDELRLECRLHVGRESIFHFIPASPSCLKKRELGWR